MSTRYSETMCKPLYSLSAVTRATETARVAVDLSLAAETSPTLLYRLP